jgi:cell division inhibitor SepF
MGALRRAGVWLGLVEDEDDDRGYRGFGDDFTEEDDQEEPPVTPRARTAERVDSPRSTVRPIARSGSSATVSYPTRESLALATQLQVRERPAAAVEEESDDRRYQITTLHPTTYNEARTIGEHFRDGVPVIMNLTEMDESDAKRLVDFAAGLVFGLRGNFNRVFLLSPANVQVTAEDKAKIAEGGFFNQS